MRITVATATLALASLGLSFAADGQAAMTRMRTNIPPEALGPALRSLAKELNFQIVYASKDVALLRTHCAISRFGPTRFPDLGPTFPEFPAEPSERMFTRLSSSPQACG
ncbi:MAG: hypothetical protein ACYDAE_10850, partial [Steroidobacteraceae bacterium]